MREIEISQCKTATVCLGNQEPRSNMTNQIVNWKNRCGCSADECRMMVQHNLEHTLCEEVRCAKMRLYLKCWQVINYWAIYTLEIWINQKQWDPYNIKWENQTSAVYYKDIEVTTEDFEQGYIDIDLSDLVKEWSEEIIPNYGITIWAKTTGIDLTIYGMNSSLVPKLYVKYGRYEDESIGIQLQVDNKALQVLDYDQPIVFNKVVAQQSQRIRYDMAGTIILPCPGNYLFSWWVAVGGAEAVKDISFALKQIGGVEIVSAAPIALPSQMSGSALIRTEQNNQSFQLVSLSKEKLQLGQTNTQANLTVVRI
ncbi:MAG: DNRLRE domain-containing protein [Cellulosilyticaceae bacterium]